MVSLKVSRLEDTGANSPGKPRCLAQFEAIQTCAPFHHDELDKHDGRIPFSRAQAGRGWRHPRFLPTADAVAAPAARARRHVRPAAAPCPSCAPDPGPSAHAEEQASRPWCIVPWPPAPHTRPLRLWSMRSVPAASPLSAQTKRKSASSVVGADLQAVQGALQEARQLNGGRATAGGLGCSGRREHETPPGRGRQGHACGPGSRGAGWGDGRWQVAWPRARPRKTSCEQ
jgi:hypothetical protein